MTTEEIAATAPDGTRIAAALTGDSGPLLLMIPGLGATRAVFAPVAPLLVDAGLRCLVVDNRGVGASEVTGGPYTMAQLATDAVSVLDAAGARTAHVFGASMGGMIAQHVALDHGGRVERLVLACTGPGRSHAVKADPRATAALLGAGAHTPEEAYRIACTVLYEPGFAAAHADLIEAQILDRATRPVPARAFQAQRAASWEHDVYDRLPRITSPTLVMHGTADAVMPVENGRILAERIPGARLVEFAGRGHLFFHEAPEQFVGAVAAFLLGGGG